MDKEQSGNETHKTVSPASSQGTPCFVAKNATIVGNVTLGKESTVWFQAVIRGDAHRNRRAYQYSGWNDHSR